MGRRGRDRWREREDTLCFSSLCTLLTKAWDAHCVYLIYRHLTPMRRRDRTSIKVPLPLCPFSPSPPLPFSLLKSTLSVSALCLTLVHVAGDSAQQHSSSPLNETELNKKPSSQTYPSSRHRHRPRARPSTSPRPRPSPSPNPSRCPHHMHACK